MSISAKTTGAKIGSSAIGGIHGWRCTEKADALDATVGADGGFTDTDTGCIDVEGEMSGYFDMSGGAITSIAPGTVITNLRLYRALGDTTPAYEFPSAVVTERGKVTEVRGRIEFTCRFKNKGTYTYSD